MCDCVHVQSANVMFMVCAVCLVYVRWFAITTEISLIIFILFAVWFLAKEKKEIVHMLRFN